MYPSQRSETTNELGFTMVELLVVVAIIGILATLASAQLVSYRQRSYDAASITDLKSGKTALEAFFAENTVYPY